MRCLFDLKEMQLFEKAYINHSEMITSLQRMLQYDTLSIIHILEDAVKTLQEYSESIVLSDDEDYFCYELQNKCKMHLELFKSEIHLELLEQL